MEEAPRRQFNLVLSFLSFVRGANTPGRDDIDADHALEISLHQVLQLASQTSCRTGSTAPCAESHSPSLTQQDVCMGEYTDAVLTQALGRAAVAVATQQSREDSSRIKNV